MMTSAVRSSACGMISPRSASSAPRADGPVARSTTKAAAANMPTAKTMTVRVRRIDA